jgi:hypothetical protein
MAYAFKHFPHFQKKRIWEMSPYLASQELRCDELLLLNDDADRKETFKWQDAERTIQLMPLWKWLER